MVLKVGDEIYWLTDRPNRFAGAWLVKKLVKKWDVVLGYVEPNTKLPSL